MKAKACEEETTEGGVRNEEGGARNKEGGVKTGRVELRRYFSYLCESRHGGNRD